MPLQKQLLPIPYQTGVDQKTDQRWLSPGTQSTVVNGCWTKAGLLEKRKGYTRILNTDVIQGASPPTKGLRLSVYKNLELDQVGVVGSTAGTNLFAQSPGRSFGPSTFAKAWSFKGRMPDCVATWGTVAEHATNIVESDVGVMSSGHIIYTWWDLSVANGSLFCEIVDPATGEIVLNPTDITPPGNVGVVGPRLLTTSFFVNPTAAILVGTVDGLGNLTISAVKILLTGTSVSISGWTTLVSSPSLQSIFSLFWDAAVCQGGALAGQQFALYYLSNIGPPIPTQTVRRFDFNFALQGTVTYNIVTAITCMSISSDSVFGNYTLAWGSNTGVNAQIRASKLSSIFAPFYTNQVVYDSIAAAPGFLRIGLGALNGTRDIVAASSNTGSFAAGELIAVVGVDNGGLNTGTIRIYEGILAANPFLCTQTQRVYMGAFYNGLTQGTTHVVDVTNTLGNDIGTIARPVATIAPRTSGFDTTVYNTGVFVRVPNVWSAPTGSQYTMIAKNQLDAAGKIGLLSVNLDFSGALIGQSTELGESLVFNGGTPVAYDGVHPFELGFTRFPEQPTGAVGAAGLPNGTYRYKAIYEWWDNRGQRHRSAPSISSLSIVSANQSINVTVLFDPVTFRDGIDSFGVVLYRTDGSGASVFHRVTPDAIPLAQVNNPLAVSVTVNDNLSDAVLTTKEILYDTGGVVANQSPPSLTCLATYKNRIWAVAGDQRTIWYTKTYTTGEGPAFADEFTLSLNEQGPILALWVQDDKLYMASRDHIYFIAGDGALDTGQQSQIDGPYKLATDVGCINPRSVLTTQLGTFFQSTRGIYLLTRSQEAEYVGKAVEDTLALNPIITSAVLVQTLNEVRFTCIPTETSPASGVTLRFNYLMGMWSIDQLTPSVEGGTPEPMVSGALANGTYFALSPTAQAYQETNGVGAASYMDNGNYYPLSVETAWIKSNGIQGWGRFWRVYGAFDNPDPSNITVSFAFDYSASYTQATALTSATIAGWSSALPQFQVMVGQQKSEAIRIKIADSRPLIAPFAVTGQGPKLLDVDLEVGIYPSGVGTRLPANQRG